ncbi:MAG: hypothetical protein K6T35_05915 [Meiothermus silvanus]|nr:hypothetical protein [Allomeiothermus silvanus]
MRYNPGRHHRRSIRRKGFDDSSLGAYFVTVCVQGRRGMFGELVDGKMRLSPAGEMVLEVWNQMPKHYPGVGADAFVGMPNHIHGIIVLGNVGVAPRGRSDPRGRYYERVIRDEDELRAIREHIVHNPLGWDTDEENPHR